jgi:hypothetical protein
VEVTAISEEDKHLSLLSIHGYRLAIDYFWGSERRGRELSELSWWIRGTWFVTRCLDSSTRSRLLVWLASLWGEIAARIPGGDYADARLMPRR